MLQQFIFAIVCARVKNPPYGTPLCSEVCINILNVTFNIRKLQPSKVCLNPVHLFYALIMIYVNVTSTYSNYKRNVVCHVMSCDLCMYHCRLQSGAMEDSVKNVAHHSSGMLN